MKKYNRYETSGLAEAQFEPGSRGRVLKNLLGINKKREIDLIEAEAQLDALKKLVGVFGQNHRFTAADVCQIHTIWLAKIYSWAGQYRNVNLGKGNFAFAVAMQIPQLLKTFEKDCLQKFTPCRFKTIDQIAEALAVVHTELVLIHPFRDGNGRVARMLAILMSLQAGLPPLDFGGIAGRKRKEYFAAVRAGLDRDYLSMTKIFAGVIRRTLRIYGQG